MWKHAEVVGMLDRSGFVRAVSRNEEEAVVKNIVGREIRQFIAPQSCKAFDALFQAALAGQEVEALLAGVADDGSTLWGRVRLKQSPEQTAPVLLHMRRLPRSWSRLSEREKAVIEALNAASMNSKRAAKQLGISVHTLNSHRRSICRKCQLSGVGEFWIYVEHCR
jgi:DNA-binding CsgD family transcriptional regulator